MKKDVELFFRSNLYDRLYENFKNIKYVIVTTFYDSNIQEALQDKWFKDTGMEFLFYSIEDFSHKNKSSCDLNILAAIFERM